MDLLRKVLAQLLRDSRHKTRWRILSTVMAAVVVFVTTYSLILPAITLEENAAHTMDGLFLEPAGQAVSESADSGFEDFQVVSDDEDAADPVFGDGAGADAQHAPLIESVLTDGQQPEDIPDGIIEEDLGDDGDASVQESEGAVADPGADSEADLEAEDAEAVYAAGVLTASGVLLNDVGGLDEIRLEYDADAMIPEGTVCIAQSFGEGVGASSLDVEDPLAQRYEQAVRDMVAAAHPDWTNVRVRMFCLQLKKDGVPVAAQKKLDVELTAAQPLAGEHAALLHFKNNDPNDELQKIDAGQIENAGSVYIDPPVEMKKAQLLRDTNGQVSLLRYAAKKLDVFAVVTADAALEEVSAPAETEAAGSTAMPQSETEIVTETEAAGAVVSETEFKEETKADSEPEFKEETEAESEFEEETEAETEFEEETEAETEFEEETEAETEFEEETEAETEFKEETETEAEYPAQEFSAQTDSVDVYIFAPHGAFPAGTTMQVADVDDDETIAAVSDAAAADRSFVQRVQAVDITFRDAAGAEIEPLIPIRVEITAQEKQENETAVVVHVDNEGNAQTVETAAPITQELAGAVPDGETIAFDADAFSVYAIVYTIDCKVISASGDTYEIMVSYGEDAKIPEGAQLHVEEVTEENEAYEGLRKDVTDQLSEEIGLIPLHPALFDISIWADGQEIEPAEGSEVKVEVKLVRSAVNGVLSGEDSLLLVNDAPLSEAESEISQNLRVIHQVEEGRVEVMETTDTISDQEVVSEFMTGSFSNWLVFLDQDVEEIVVGRGDTITLRPYSQWVWNQQNVVDGQSVSWKYPDTAGHMTVQTKRYTDEQLNQTYDLYHLTAMTNPGDFYIETTAGKRIHVIVKGEAVSGVPETVSGLDTIKVNLFNYDLDHSLDVSQNTASNIEQNPGQYSNDGINAASALKFLGWGASNGNNRINNYTATAVTPNIVQSTLSSGTGANSGNKYPKLNGNGNTSLQYLFSSGNSDVDAHMGVTGLFRQDEDGYYYFNSNTNYALYNDGSNSFTLYEHTYTQATTKNNTSGQDETSKPIGFFPFHPYDSNNNLSPNHDTALDHHFGISMEVKFALPPDKQLHKADGTTDHIVFEFSGDDDMWVFVDDNLALDMGGIHQPLTGRIDFTTDSRFQGGQEYTLRIFYLERGGCDSNCSIRFNIPLTKRNFEFEKQDADNKSVFIKDAKFQLFKDADCTIPAVNDTNGEYYYGTSDDNGKVLFQTVSIGDYYMKEIEAPSGYRLNETTYRVKLTEDDVTIRALNGNNEPTECDADTSRNGVQIANRKNPDLTVAKQWQNAAGQPIDPGSGHSATFKLQRFERHEGDTVIPDTSQPCTFRVYRYKENNAPVQVGSDYTFKGGTNVSVDWGYSNGYYGNNYGGIKHYKLNVNENYREKTDPVVIPLPESGSASIYIRDENVGTQWGAGVINITVNGTPYAPSDTTEHVSTDWTADTEFNNGADTPTLTLPEADADPWTGRFSNLTTIEKKGSYTYYYRYYLIESSKSPSDCETTYVDGSGQVVTDPASLRTDENSSVTVINRELMNIPVEKYWYFSGDEDPDSYSWTATFQLQYSLVDKTTGETVTPFAPVEGKQVELTSSTAGHGSFDGLPIYTTQNGTEYRIIYSVEEIAYRVWRTSDNETVAQYQDPDYYDDPVPQIGEKYSLHYVQDAGENGPAPEDYKLIDINTPENRHETKNIDISLEKTWPAGLDVSGQSADFVLKRYVYEEYRNFPADTQDWVEITLDTGNGKTQKLTVAKNWQMTIFFNVKAQTNAESIVFSDGSGSGIPPYSYDNSSENKEHTDYIRFTADRSKTVTLVGNGASYVEGGADGFRLTDINNPNDMVVKQDRGFEIPFTLSDENDWRTALHHLTAIEEDTQYDVEHPLEITRYVYRYYLEETGCSLDGYAPVFRDSSGTLHGDENNRIDVSTAVTAENRLKPGSLKITKTVTVDGDDPTPDTASLVDGTYHFTVAGVAGTETAGEQPREITVVISGGQANTVEVEDLTPGQYTVTETAPTNGTSLTGGNGLTALVEAGKTGAAVSPDGCVEFTNNINTTQLTVHKVWTDDGQEGVDHSGDQISYTLYRIPYTVNAESEITEYDPEEVSSAPGYRKILRANTTPAWTNVITDLPVTGGLTPSGAGTQIPVQYEYYIAEGTFQGYKQSVSGGSEEGVYAFTIINEPHSTFDRPTDIEVQKEWQNESGQPDQDAHDDDSITFSLEQTKYRSDIHPVRITLVNGDGTVSALSKTIYMPGNRKLNLRADSQSNGNAHRVNVSGTNKDGTYLPNKTVYIDRANGGRDLTLTLQKENDSWSTEVSGTAWSLVLYDDSHEGSVTENDNIVEEEDLLAWVLENGTAVENAHDPYEYAMMLDADRQGTEVLKYSEHAIGQTEGTEDTKWQGGVSDLPFFEKGDDGRFYVYTYAVKEVKIGSAAVTEPSDNEDFKGQTSQYYVNWEQNTQTGVWTITNRKRPVIDITVKKMDVNDLETGTDLLPGAAFRLERYANSSYQGKDTAWSEQEESDTEGTGELSFTGLGQGYYQLVETKFPDGYVQTGVNPRFRVKDENGSLVIALIGPDGNEISNEESETIKIDGLTLKVGNTPGAALPSTGGPGTAPFTIFGSLLLLGAGVLLWRRRRLV